MLMVSRIGTVLLLALALASASQAASFDEGLDGDLSDDRFAPTGLLLDPGANVVTATQQGVPRDIDYLTVSVPVGQVLAAIVLDDYVAGPGNQAFLGLQEGTVFTVDPGLPIVGELLGGIVYGEGNVGTDILPEIGVLGGAIGFSGPLASGDYTFWLNQTGPVSTATLSLILVPEPAAASLLGLGLLGIALARRESGRGAGHPGS